MSPAQILDYVGAFCAGVLAIATLFRAGRSVPRWAFASGMVLLALESVFLGLSSGAVSSAELIRWQQWRLFTITLVPGTWLLFSITYARGEDRAVKAWKRLGIISVSVILAGFGWWFRDNLVVSIDQTSWGAQWQVRVSWLGNMLWLVVLVCSVWVVVNLERTFRASVGTTRWRIKYMLLGVGLIFVVRIYTSSQVVLFRGIDSPLETINSIALIVGSLVLLRSFFRTGQLEVEVYPSRAVLQKSLTIFLAGTYLLIVGVLAKIVAYIGADAAFAAQAFFVMLAVVLLAIVIQSDRARLELRRFVSRNFRRSAYDYRAVWKTFTDGTASRVEQTDLCRGLVRMIAEIFDALSVSIFLVDEKREALVPVACTTPLNSINEALESEPEVKPDISLITKRFQNRAEPVDIETSDEAWAVMLRRYHPTQFTKGGNRICVPMIGRGDLLGIIVVGDRVAGVPFSFEDFDMLKCVGDHAAASILNVQLSTKLLQAKELEAFQAMAAFFVHDLKNAASTLNLMLQNLPIHYNNPEFREDALRGISKTASHINRLVGRLGMLRHELKIEIAQADINEVVSAVLAGIEQAPGYVLTKDISPLPKIPLDREQMHKVITNLILNAVEAVPPQGQVHIRTAQEDGGVVVTVTDTGCGMSADFLNQSLFRPFQTTKKNGLGIGMFQSKMIIEAHRGRISVTSEVGKGTTFRIFLPATAA